VGMTVGLQPAHRQSSGHHPMSIIDYNGSAAPPIRPRHHFRRTEL
jgi:hypothetical protein